MSGWATGTGGVARPRAMRPAASRDAGAWPTPGLRHL